MMNPDGFGFDSSVNYFWWSLHTDEFPWCEAGHLITAPGEIEGDARSLSAGEAQKLLLFPANWDRAAGRPRDEWQKSDWMNEQKKETL